MTSPSAAPNAVPSAARSGVTRWLVGLAVGVALAAAYSPALHGGFLWDDAAHLPAPELRTTAGLWRILFEPGASQQYYPLAFAGFWLEQRVFGGSTFGYHLVNLLLHGAAALLVASILRRLAVPGAALAAAIFALHPIEVESVAWIAELKNTLSTVFYLTALRVYLEFDQPRGERGRGLVWLAAFALFLCAILSKSVTGSLPAAILVLAWWKRGRIEWRRDVVPLLPWFAASAAFGAFTARFESQVVGASNAGFVLSPTARVLVAGRAFWFYLGKLAWPSPLIFMYPRWDVDPALRWQWLYPAAAAVLLVALWVLRGRLGRAPLAAALFYIGTLLPAAGLVDIFPFKFSFVADHFQYLAGLGPIALAAAVLVRGSLPLGAMRPALGSALVAVLAVLTWRQAYAYQSAEALWRQTVADNPRSSLAQIGLGVLLADRGEHQKAIERQELALAIDPGSPEAHLNLARSYEALGHDEQAAKLYEEGLRLEPRYGPDVKPRLVRLYLALGRYENAVALAEQASAAEPRSGMLQALLGLAYEGLGRRDDASRAFVRALALDPAGEGGRIAAQRLSAPRGQP
jgi:tetratricopeptide (TPR) repeat protein